MSKKEVRYPCRLNCRVDEDTHKYIEKESALRNKDKSGIVRDIIIEWVKAQKKERGE